MSDRKNIVTHSHLSFENGYYVTEYDIILKVVKPNIFVLTTKGWDAGQNYYDLWYDSMTCFIDIPQNIVHELNLTTKEMAKQKSNATL